LKKIINSLIYSYEFYDSFNIQDEYQRLFFLEKELDNNRLLKSYKFDSYDDITLNLYIGHKNGILINIERSCKKILKYSFLPDTKIESIKNTIYEFVGLPTEFMELSFEFKVLNNEKTLNDYNIINQSSLNMEFKSKNGIIIFIRKTFEKMMISLDVSEFETIYDIKKNFR
jgi:hypothetical protein